MYTHTYLQLQQTVYQFDRVKDESHQLQQTLQDVLGMVAWQQRNAVSLLLHKQDLTVNRKPPSKQKLILVTSTRVISMLLYRQVLRYVVRAVHLIPALKILVGNSSPLNKFPLEINSLNK
jgi:hypothetical protein